jgi:hypothetical protein
MQQERRSRLKTLSRVLRKMAKLRRKAIRAHKIGKHLSLHVAHNSFGKKIREGYLGLP